MLGVIFYLFFIVRRGSGFGGPFPSSVELSEKMYSNKQKDDSYAKQIIFSSRQNVASVHLCCWYAPHGARVAVKYRRSRKITHPLERFSNLNYFTPTRVPAPNSMFLESS